MSILYHYKLKYYFNVNTYKLPNSDLFHLYENDLRNERQKIINKFSLAENMQSWIPYWTTSKSVFITLQVLTHDQGLWMHVD